MFMKRIIIIILLTIAILFSMTSLSFAQQNRIIIFPITSIGDKTDFPWAKVAISKSIEYTVECVSIYGILKDNFILEEFKAQNPYANPYSMSKEYLVAYGKNYNGDYLIACQYNYKDYSDKFLIDLNIIETSTGEIVETISVDADAKRLLTIGNDVLVALLKRHKYEPTQIEKNALKALDFVKEPLSTKEWCIGYNAYLRGNFSAAVDSFINATRYFPEFSEAHRMLGILRSQVGDTKQAYKDLQEAVSSNITNFRSWKDLGDFFCGSKNYQQAAKFYEKALQIRSIDIELFIAVAKINYELGFYGNAKDWYEKAYRINDLDPEVLEGLAKITAYQSKDWVTAAKYADKLLSVDDKNVTAYIIMANYFAVVKKDYYNALNMMIESLKFNKAVESIYMIGVLYIKYYEETKKQSHFAEGIRALEYCISQKYKIPEIYIEVSKAYALVSNGSKAAEFLDLAFKNGYTNIDIIFDSAFDNVKDHPDFKKVVTYWYYKLTGGGN